MIERSVDKVFHNILQLFPKEQRGLFRYTADRQEYVNEIRLRCERPVLVYERGKEWFLNQAGEYTPNIGEAVRISGTELECIMQHICHYSLYAFEEEIRQGYITVAGGHRIGVVGQVVMADYSQIRTIKHIRGLNMRISHQIKGVAEPYLPYIYREGEVKSILLVSPPGCGKTTLLRDLIRCVSDGNVYGQGLTVGVVDERSEIAGCYMGIPQNDIGIRTDVLDACPKVKGMMLLVRSMAPKVIAIDELGSKEEAEVVQVVSNCGTKIIATMHGNDLEDIYKKDGMEGLLRQGSFEVIMFMTRSKGKCVVNKIYERRKEGEWKYISW